jgi:molybdopterin/thiamine biosynthesis adenylyltransferase
MPTRDLLDDFLSSAVARRTALEEVDVTAPTQEELTEEENQELVERAMANLGLSAPTAVPATTQITLEEVSVDDIDKLEEEEKKEEEEESVIREAPDPYEGVPKEERPVVVPDYTNVREETQRFSDAEWFSKVQEKVVILAGIGGIGSNMAIILAKLNPRSLYLFDDDIVESVNLAGQFYSIDDVGLNKVDALARSIAKYTNYSSVVAINRRYRVGEDIAGDIMICGFDSMRSRKDYYNVWKERVFSLPEENRKGCLFMDGRLTATEFQIFCITGDDDYYMEEYEKNWLFNDYEVRELRCSFKQTGYLAQMIGSFMVNLFVNFCANEVNPIRGMGLPFLTSYRGDLLYLDLRR